MTVKPFACQRCFNSRSRMGSDPCGQSIHPRIDSFQFALPHGERPTSLRLTVPSVSFQFALPHGERPRPSIHSPQGSGFNSRSRMGSDQNLAALEAALNVSIRAPAWGATAQHVIESENARVSIRAPAWGATDRTIFAAYRPFGFNSRSRMGSDSESYVTGVIIGVSIRAPAWGATPPLLPPPAPPPVSIRAPAWGAT